MALCFFAVIILSFFTGIAIGYIIFEFYIMNRSDINFNYVEGDEVNNFLEEIRRSKDNGARMLNYRTNTGNNTDTALTRNELGTKRSTTSKVASLSSRIRMNMIDKADVSEETIQTNDLIEEVVPAVQEENENSVLDKDIIEENDAENTETFNEQNAESEEYDAMDDLLDSDENDFEVDDEYLKKYYYTENNDIDDAKTSLEDSPLNNIEEVDNIDNIEENNSVEETDVVTAEENPNVTKNIVIEKCLEDNTQDIRIDKDEAKETASDKYDVQDKIISNTAIELPTSDKQDKIASNVCIPLGGSSNKDNKSNSFVAIPLTMTEKPVEPEAPPKRKRGRPRKKK
jgi:hypothetical protein